MHEMRLIMQNGGKRDLLAAKKRGRSGPDQGALTKMSIRREETRRTDQRREDRHLNLVDRAELTFRRQRFEVRVLNVSSEGVMIEAALEARIGERVHVRFEECNRTKAIVRWIRDGRIGLEFPEETVIIAPAEVRRRIVSGRRDDEQTTIQMKRQRAPRRSLVWQGILHTHQGSMQVRLRNISAEGAMMDCSEDMLLGTPVVLQLAGSDAIEGQVHWSHAGQLGVGFNELFDMESLARSRPEAEPQSPEMVKPDYLRTEGNPDCPWSARTTGLRIGDLEP